MIKGSAFFITTFFFLFLFSCETPEDTTESKDNIDLAYSILFKTSECGNHPEYPLFIASGSAKPAKRDVQACIITIIQQKCPFDNYPYYCLKIFKNFDYNIKNPLDKKKDLYFSPPMNIN
jgi:hypothetical protein